MRLIDPPSPFASVQEWEAFLNEMLAINNPDDEVKAAITDARRVIAKKNGTNQ